MKLSIGLFLILLTSSAKAFEIKGSIQLKEAWERRIYLSSIQSFDDMNTASEEFVIASAAIETDGSFHIEGNQLPTHYGLYRLHVVKKGDPIGTLFIGGQEENHHHFIMNNASQLNFINADSFFATSSFSNSSINKNFDELKKKIDLFQKAPPIPSKVNWDYQEKQFRDYLWQYADTSQNMLSALYAIYHLNIEQDYEMHKGFLQSFLNKWKSKSNFSPYFIQLQQQDEFFRYRENSKAHSYWIYFVFFALGILIFVFWKRRKSPVPEDPILKKQNQLTIQEQKIYNLLAVGKTNKEISNELNIEVSTVKSHLNNIYSKLGVKSRKEIYKRGAS